MTVSKFRNASVRIFTFPSSTKHLSLPSSCLFEVKPPGPRSSVKTGRAGRQAFLVTRGWERELLMASAWDSKSTRVAGRGRPEVKGSLSRGAGWSKHVVSASCSGLPAVASPPPPLPSPCRFFPFLYLGSALEAAVDYFLMG